MIGNSMRGVIHCESHRDARRKIRGEAGAAAKIAQRLQKVLISRGTGLG
jgi:hypothetical protein